ncbi:hypothetical protein TNCV_2352721 [Trichonephila clavipes]|nr:hypothetical protein TNCV_2352721 [Trichonephila clavipes]
MSANPLAYNLSAVRKNIDIHIEIQGLSNVPLISAEDETYEEKQETIVDVIKAKAKGDVDPVIRSQQRVDLDDDEIEEKPYNCQRELQKLSRMTVAKLQQKDERGREKLAWKLSDFFKRDGMTIITRKRYSTDNESKGEKTSPSMAV